MNTNKIKRKKAITLTIVGMVLVVALGIGLFNLRMANQQQSRAETETTTTTEATTTTVSETTTVASTDEEYSQEFQWALNSLERPDSVVTEEVKSPAVSAIKEATNYLKSMKDSSEELNLYWGNHLAATTESQADVYIRMLRAGYELDADSIMVFKSFSEDKAQFAFQMTKKSDNTKMAFAGNYILVSGQLELLNNFGTPTDVAN